MNIPVMSKSGGIANYDGERGIYYGVIAQNAVSPEAMDDCLFGPHSRDLSHESAVAEIKARIKRIGTREELAELLKEVMGSFRLERDKWAFDQCAEHLTFTEGLEQTEEAIESVWSEIKQDFNDRYECDSPEWFYEANSYKLTRCLDYDIFVLASHYFTFCRQCSPCVPNAGDLDNPEEDGRKAYCLGHEWFDEHNPCPYPVYSVETGELIPAESEVVS